MMFAVALVAQGLLAPATVVTSRPLATAVAPRVAVVRPPLAPVHRSRCGCVRLQAEDDEDSGGDSEPPRRSAVLFRRLNDVLFLLFTIAIQVIGAASVIGILLNLSGYGYRFSAERGIEVGTLAEVRSGFAERRFEERFLEPK